MELKAENVKNIRSLALCKEFLRQAIEQNDQLQEELHYYKKWHQCWLELVEHFKGGNG